MERYQVGFLSVPEDHAVDVSPPDILFEAPRRVTVNRPSMLLPQRKYLSTALSFNPQDADFVLTDGTSIPGTVTTGAAAAKGDTTVSVTVGTGIIVPNGIMVYHPATEEYATVLSTTTTSGKTSKITTSAALTTAWAADSSITFGPRQFYIAMGEGKCSWTENSKHEYRTSRGLLDPASGGEVRKAKQEPMAFTLDANFDYYTSDTGENFTLTEVLNGDAVVTAAGWVSSDTENPCAPWALDVNIRRNNDCGDIKGEWITLRCMRFDSKQYGLDDGIISIAGTSYKIRAESIRTSVFPLADSA